MSKNADPNGCPGTVLGDCDPVCARCGRDMGAEVERLRAAPETSDPDVDPAKPWTERRAGLSWDDIDDLIDEHAFVGTDDSGTPYSFVYSSDAADKLWELLEPFSNFRAALAAAATPAPPVDVAATPALRIDQVAEVLRAHERFGMAHCGCAQWAEIDPGTRHSEHVARAIARALTATPTEETRTGATTNSELRVQTRAVSPASGVNGPAGWAQ